MCAGLPSSTLLETNSSPKEDDNRVLSKIPTEHIKKEHDTQYSQYKDSVEFVANSGPIEIEDDENEDLVAILNENNHDRKKSNEAKVTDELEEDGGSFLDNLTPQYFSGENICASSSKQVDKSEGTSSERAILMKSTDMTPGEPNRQTVTFLKPFPMCQQLKNWRGTLVRNSSIEIENWSDDGTPPESDTQGNSGKDLPQNTLTRNVLSQNMSLLCSSQVTHLISSLPPLPPIPTQIATKTNNIKYSILPWFKLIHFSYQGINEHQENIETLSAKIKIPNEENLIEIKDSDSLCLLLAPDKRTFESLLKLLRSHGTTYKFDPKQAHQTDLYQNVLALALFQFFERMTNSQRTPKNVLIKYEINERNQTVMAKVGHYKREPSQNLNVEEALEPDITNNIQYFKENL